MPTDVKLGQIKVVKPRNLAVSDFFGLDTNYDGLGLIQPVHGQVGPRLPQLSLGHGLGQPPKVFGYIEESGGRAGEIAVHILTATHHQPRIVQERVILFTTHPFLVFGVIAFARRLGRFFGNRAQLYGLLSLFDRPIKVSGRLRRFGILFGLGGVYVDDVRIVILVGFLHFLEGLHVMAVAIVVDVVSSDEGCVLASRRSILLAGIARHKCTHGHKDRDCRDDSAYAASYRHCRIIL